MSSSSSFSPSRIRKEDEPRVERVGRATFSFRDEYSGTFEFFPERPIRSDNREQRSQDTARRDKPTEG